MHAAGEEDMKRLAWMGLVALGTLPLQDGAGAREALGVVASASPEASEAGALMLEAGGNAVDAAVATAFALGVTEPAGSGLGGQLFMLVVPHDGEPLVINGSSRAPSVLPPDADRSALAGRRASTVPSTVKVLDYALREHGSGNVDWAQAIAPARRYAEQGYRVGAFRHRSLMRYAHVLREDATAADEYLDPGGKVPPQGARVRHPRLARTLARLAGHGAEDFYRGEIARDIVRDMQANGGWITAEDLATFPAPEVTPPLVSRYRGYAALSLPPPTGGWVVLQGLNVLDEVESSLLVPGRTERNVWLAETLRVVHGARAERPVTALDAYRGEVARRLSPARAAELLRLVEPPRTGGREAGGETTHFTVADAAGTVVAVTASINAYFGARVASPELGFLYNDYMREFEPAGTDHPFALSAGGLPYSSMSATVLTKDGAPVLGLGSPGSKRIISAVVQVISNWVDGGQRIPEAVAEPRLHVVPDDELFLEARGRTVSAATLLALELRGYGIMRPLSSLYTGDLNPYFGGVHAVAREHGAWQGAADPRRDGAVRVAWGPAR